MGIPVPADVRDALQQALAAVDRDLGALRRSDPLGWHLTLAFVGELADERVPTLRTAVVDTLAAARPPRLGLTVDGAGRFGRRVLFGAITDRPDGTLARLGATLQTTIERAGLPVERREVRPHVTVARSGRAAPVTEETVGALQATLGARPPIRWTPRALAVYRATDREGPARYSVDASVPLSVG